MKVLQNNKFRIEYDKVKGGIKKLTLNSDQHQLNWVKSGSGLFGSMYGEYNVTSTKYEPNKITVTYYYNELEVVCNLTMSENDAYLDYVFTNKQLNPLTFNTGDIGIFAPFNVSYNPFVKEHQLTKKCHAHIWCGESSSYIYALRMNGEENNFAVQVVGGQVADYAIIRKMQINDRGDFVLLFRPFTINPMDKLHLRLKLFSFRNEKRFFEKALKEESYMQINIDRFTYRVKEEIKVELQGKNINSINVMAGGKPCEVAKIGDDRYLLHGSFDSVGVKRFTIKYNNHTTHFDINIIKNELELIDERLNFIVDNQQNHDKGDARRGAYYLYDFSEGRKYYEASAKCDKNLGKDRVCMPIAILQRLLSNQPISEEFKAKLEDSIKLGLDFIDRAIVRDNGLVCDTAFYKISPIDNKSVYGWYSLLYLLAYEYFGEKKYFDKAVKILLKFYEKGGVNAYVELPILKIIQFADKLGEKEVAKQLKEKYLQQIENVLKHGIHFPTEYARFSDSVVASATDIMLDAYDLTGEDKYLIEAKKLFKILLSFSGKQPSVFMFDSPIKHWDSHKYGQSRLYGDNFPSQSCVITAKALSRYAKPKNKPQYQTRANNILLDALLLYNDNKASCAYVYPFKVNSFSGKKFDALANNQDWIIYYNLVYNTDFNKVSE